MRILISSAISAAILGTVGVPAVDAARGLVDDTVVTVDTRHLGDGILGAAMMRSDQPFVVQETLTCADDPCASFVEPALDGLTVSGRTRFLYGRTSEETFVLIGRSGDAVAIYDSREGGLVETPLGDDGAPDLSVYGIEYTESDDEESSTITRAIGWVGGWLP